MIATTTEIANANQTPVGILGNHPIQCGGAVDVNLDSQSGIRWRSTNTVELLAKCFAIPRKMVMEPNVTMKGGMRSTPMNNPLHSPHAAPVPKAASIATDTGKSAFKVHASTVAQSMLAVPADKSIPPVMMISVIPKAATATGAVNTKMTRALRISIKRP